MNYIDEKIKFCEKQIETFRKSGLEEKNTGLKGAYHRKHDEYVIKLDKYKCLKAQAEMIIDGLKDNMLTIKTETRADHRDITIRPLKR